LTVRASGYIREVIKGFEGYEPTPKPDPGRGILTVGWGHTRTAELYRGKTITRQTAETLFSSDVANAENYVNNFARTNKLFFTQPQFDALVSFVFNTGNIPESIKKRLTDLQGRTVAQTMRLYNKAGTPNNLTPLPGLTKRRFVESNRFNKTKNLFWFSGILLLLYVRNR